MITVTLSTRDSRLISAVCPMTPCAICGDKSEREGYGCTRPKGHDGAHVAHGPDGRAIALWSKEVEQCA